MAERFDDAAELEALEAWHRARHALEAARLKAEEAQRRETRAWEKFTAAVAARRARSPLAPAPDAR